MTDRDKAVELLARALAGDNETMWAYRLAHCAECRERAQDHRNDATALLDQIAPMLTAQAVEAERMACTEELQLAVAAARAEERWQPIETAPKDMQIDLWSSRGWRWTDAIWDVVDFVTGREGWTDSQGHGSIEGGGPYTHWMRKPTPPSASRMGV